jgi:hypothetical protein
MATYQAQRIGIPIIQRDGKAVSLVLESDNAESITIRILSDDLRLIAERLLDAIDAVDISQTLWDSNREDGGESKAMPTVYQVSRLGFVADPKSDFRYIVLSTPKGEEVLIGLKPNQVRELVTSIQEIQSTQVSEGPPS